jgi:hypothetical protein
MPRPGLLAFFIPRLEFAAGRRPLVIDAATHAFTDFADQRLTTRRLASGAGHATKPGMDLFR